MITCGEFVSSVMNNLRFNTKDTWIPRRQVLSIGISKAKMLLAQRVDDFKLRNAFDLVSTISCFEMEEVDKITCENINIRNCKTLYKSVKKLPEVVYGRSTNSIFSVSSIDESKYFESKAPEKINMSKTLKYQRNKEDFYYFIENGHLYVTAEVEAVKVRLIALRGVEVEECECKKTDNCKSGWDYQFPITDLLLDSVRTQTIQELIMTAQIPKDENPNMDSNSKSQTVK